MSNPKIKIQAGRAVNDPRKAIIPAFTYAHKYPVTIFMIGWWDFHIDLIITKY